jgi:hypothetical protein
MAGAIQPDQALLDRMADLEVETSRNRCSAWTQV